MSTLTKSTGSRHAIRRGKKPSKNRSVKLTEDFVRKFMYIIDNNMVDRLPSIELISKSAKTGSGSNVYLYTQNSNNYIIKVTDDYGHGFNNVETEMKIYNYLNTLSILKVCDHIVLNYDSAIYTNKLNQKTFLMVNQTYTSDERIKSLLSFINSIRKNINDDNIFTYLREVIPTLLFQLMYTLECLVRAKVKHNDLHLGNVLVFINSNNIINRPENFTDDKLKYNKYIVTSRTDNDYFGPSIFKDLYMRERNIHNIDKETITYYVPDYGFKIKIFDFDRSCIYDNNNIPEIFNNTFYSRKNVHNMPIYNDTYNYNVRYVNTIPYEYIDLYKIFISIFLAMNKPLDDFEKLSHKLYQKIKDKLFAMPTNKFWLSYMFYRQKSINQYITLEKYNELFRHKTVYEQLTNIFSDDKDRLFKFNISVPEDIIKATYNINNIKQILNTSQPPITVTKELISPEISYFYSNILNSIITVDPASLSCEPESINLNNLQSLHKMKKYLMGIIILINNEVTDIDEYISTLDGVNKPYTQLGADKTNIIDSKQEIRNAGEYITLLYKKILELYDECMHKTSKA